MNDRFFSESGTPIPSVTPGQMAEIDRIAVEESGPNLYQMMENAGRNLAELLMEGGVPHGRVVVVAGTGGNGGGGICAARHLANHGAEVELVLTKPNGLSEIAGWQRRVLSSTEAVESSLSAALGEEREAPAAIVDAVLGYSLSGPPRSAAAEAIETVNRVRRRSGCLLASLDLPSGIDPLTGTAAGSYVEPDLVMTLALPKSGLLSFCKERQGVSLVLADIGIPQAVYGAVGVKRPFRGHFRMKLLPG
jgi:NAD(P)H-hydrate epimerase